MKKILPRMCRISPPCFLKPPNVPKLARLLHKKLNMVESKAVWRGKCGPFQNQGNATKAKEVIEILEDEEEEDGLEIPDGFFVAYYKGGVLPIEMAEIYNLLKWRTTPEKFREHIKNNDELGNVAELRANHF